MLIRRLDGGAELHLLQTRHAEQLFTMLKADWEYFRKWMPNLHDDYSVADSAGFIRGSLSRFAEGAEIGAGIRQSSGEMVGFVALKSINARHRTANIGYFLAAGAQGGGLVTKACRAMLDYAFGDLKLNRVDIYCAAENTKSRAVAERLGFTHEGTLREAQWVHEKFVDLAVYGMLAGEWQRKVRTEK
jgi:ribosomal-protein-serine acetyltransferase